jgi:hypothetical protein
MNSVIALLEEREHLVIITVINALGAISGELATATPCRSIVRFMREYADRCDHAGRLTGGQGRNRSRDNPFPHSSPRAVERGSTSNHRD